MHNQAKRFIRLVLISVASLDGVLKFITGLSSGIKFAGYTLLIFTWVRRLEDSISQRKRSCPRTDSTMTLGKACIQACFQPGFEKWLSKICYRACSNEKFIRQHMKNKMFFSSKWLSIICLDAHLAKSPLAPDRLHHAQFEL